MALVWELGMSGFKSRSNQLPAMGVAYPLGVSFLCEGDRRVLQHFWGPAELKLAG